MSLKRYGTLLSLALLLAGCVTPAAEAPVAPETAPQRKPLPERKRPCRPMSTRRAASLS